MVPRRHESLRYMRESHTPDAVRLRLETGPSFNYLRDFIFGAIDGAVTTFAIVAGATGAQLSPAVVLVLGGANLVADGFSMAVSNFLGTRTERQQHRQARRSEELHVAMVPEGEREEVRQIFANKGFTGDELNRAVEVITAEEERWVETMLLEEHGMGTVEAVPWRAGLATFFAFSLVGALPLLAFVYQEFAETPLWSPFTWSAVVTGVAFFGVGAVKSRFVGERWLRAGLETLAVGGIAAVLAYSIGAALREVTSAS